MNSTVRSSKDDFPDVSRYLLRPKKPKISQGRKLNDFGGLSGHAGPTRMQNGPSLHNQSKQENKMNTRIHNTFEEMA